jgi:hypothetical protein
MLAAGGKASSGYFRLLDLQVSELILHLDIFTSITETQKPAVNPDGTTGIFNRESN